MLNGLVKVQLRNGFKRKAKLTGMEKSGLVAHNSTLDILRQKIEHLQGQMNAARDEFFKEFKELAERHGLDPNVPPDQYELEKKTLSVRREFIPKDHTEDPEDSSGSGAEESGDIDAQRRDD